MVYNIIPSKIRSSQTQIISFHITINDTTFMCVHDSNNLTLNLSWKRIRELCEKHDVEFKNQTFVQFIKQLRDKHYQIDRKILSNNERNIIINNYESKCNICKTQIEDGEIDHITPLANGGSNEDINLQYLCKSCHKQKTKNEKEQ